MDGYSDQGLLCLNGYIDPFLDSSDTLPSVSLGMQGKPTVNSAMHTPYRTRRPTVFQMSSKVGLSRKRGL